MTADGAERHDVERSFASLGLDYAAIARGLPSQNAAAAAPGDVYWAGLNLAILAALRRADWHLASALYASQAEILASSGRPYIDVAHEGSRAEMRRYSGYGFVSEVYIMGGDCCHACRSADRLRRTIDAELEAPTLPHRRCPNAVVFGRCGCAYNVVTGPLDQR